jgi:hypothetical protein
MPSCATASRIWTALRQERRPLSERESDAVAVVKVQRLKGGEQAMESVKVSLCPGCSACPEVQIAGEEIRIGETGNLAVLKKEEWNVLVDLIVSGRLTRI